MPFSSQTSSVKRSVRTRSPLPRVAFLLAPCGKRVPRGEVEAASTSPSHFHLALAFIRCQSRWQADFLFQITFIEVMLKGTWSLWVFINSGCGCLVAPRPPHPAPAWPRLSRQLLIDWRCPAAGHGQLGRVECV